MTEMRNLRKISHNGGTLIISLPREVFHDELGNAFYMTVKQHDADTYVVTLQRAAKKQLKTSDKADVNAVDAF